MAKKLFSFISLFIFGMIGGIFATQIAWPYFVERPFFDEYRLDQRQVYLTEVREITIRENLALSEGIERVEKTTVAIRAKTNTGQLLESSGVVVASDGVVAALSTMAPQGSDLEIMWNGKVLDYQILKRDTKENLVLLKVQENNLPTIAFADLDRIRIGEKIFLVSALFKKEALPPVIFRSANEGVIKSFNQNSIVTNIIEQKIASGSPLFDIEGRLLGISTINAQGNVVAISVQKIKDFVGI